MAAQQNLTLALKLIRLLKQRPGKTLNQLAQILECDPRHARRYIEALEAVDFDIDSEGKRPPRFFCSKMKVGSKLNLPKKKRNCSGKHWWPCPIPIRY